MWDEEAKAEQASRELTGATGNFSSPTIIRSYENTDAGLRQANADTGDTGETGLRPGRPGGRRRPHQLGADSHRRRAHRGDQLLFGGSRTKGKVTITYIKR